MTDTTNEEITRAFRGRIQSQALCHRVGQSVARHVVMRFRKAGTWNSEIVQPIPPSLLPLLLQNNHPHRMALPDGPLVAVVENNARAIIEVADHLLSHSAEIRLAAQRHFLAAQEVRECWVSPYVLDLLRQSTDALASSDESVWIGAGLTSREAIDRDFRVNCAGVRQASRLDFDECYQDYLNKVIRPRAHCFEHDRPSIWNPADEAEQIRAKVHEWSELDNLAEALNHFVEYCGYLPLAETQSSSALVISWENNYPGRDIWEELWKWADACPSVLAKFHTTHALLENPHWIRVDEIDRLLMVIRGIITSSEADSNFDQAPLWQLRAYLLQHYQVHLEASAPGLDSEVVAASACWMAEMVAQLFHTDPQHVRKSCEFLGSNVLPMSWRRWSMARSRMAPSPLRIANLHNPFIWSDSLLATAIRRFADFPKCAGRDEYRKFLIGRLASAICIGALRAGERSSVTYAFQEPVSPSDLGLPDAPADDETIEAARQLLSAKRAVEAEHALRSILSDLRETPDGLSEFLCVALRSWPIGQTGADPVVREYLTDNGWRREVLQRIPLSSLDKLISFLINWQMLQDEEWFVRVPQILAFECENSQDAERRELLLWATIVSAMASDIASPAVRLLAGPKRTELIGLIDDWRQTTRLIAHDSEPWLAARVRGFLGTLEAYM